MVKGKVMALNFMKGILKVALTKDTGKKTKRMGLALIFIEIAGNDNKRSLERW